MENDREHIHLERSFLHEIGCSLNSAMFIVDRLTEELRKEEGRREDDPEIERLFNHLVVYLQKVDIMVKERRSLLSEELDADLLEEKEKKKKRSSANSPSHEL